MTRSLIIAVLALFVLFDLRAAVDPIKDLSISRIVVLQVDSSINPAVANYLQTELERPALGVNTMVVIKLNTPGGLVSTTKDILTLIGRSSVPVVVWVTPEGASATSAGAIIASGAHGLVMSPGTNIGAATPVGLGEDIKESDGRSKAINDLTALVRSLSETRGRNADAFEEMIAKGSSFSAESAQKKGIIDGTAVTLDDVRALYQERTVVMHGQKHLVRFAPLLETEVREMDSGQRLLNVFAHPTTAYILFILGAALLYFEFQAPGGYVAGGVGVLCLLLAGIAFQVLPLNFGAIILLLVGIVLLILEIYFTSYGLLAVAGLACLTVGSLFLYRHQDGWISVSYGVIFSTLAGVATFLGVVGWYLARSRSGQQSFFTHADQSGEVMRELGQDGSHWLYQIKVHGEIWKARSQEALTIGDKVKVRRQNGQDLSLEIFKA